MSKLAVDTYNTLKAYAIERGWRPYEALVCCEFDVCDGGACSARSLTLKGSVAVMKVYDDSNNYNEYNWDFETLTRRFIISTTKAALETHISTLEDFVDNIKEQIRRVC